MLAARARPPPEMASNLGAHGAPRGDAVVTRGEMVGGVDTHPNIDPYKHVLTKVFPCSSC